MYHIVIGDVGATDMIDPPINLWRDLQERRRKIHHMDDDNYCVDCGEHASFIIGNAQPCKVFDDEATGDARNS